MKRAWLKLLEFVPTRGAAALLFFIAFGLFWVEALGWPMAKGRDTWDYLVYYLQLADAAPPLEPLQVFRTPITPVVVGAPMQLGGTALLELVFAVLFAASIVAWSATAAVFGRIPALFTAALLLAYPAYATIFHQAASDGVFAAVLAGWAFVLARTLARPTTAGFVVLGLGFALLVLTRPANQVLFLPLLLAPLLAPGGWRRRLVWSGACLAAALVPLGGWAVHNGVRYDDTTVARGGRAWVPFLRVFLADKTISPENGSASRRLAVLIDEHVLAKDPHRELGVSLFEYLENGSNYETVRLIALSDRELGWEEDYDVLFDSAVEAIREHPGTYLRGVADVFWEFLMQRPLREDVVRREQTAPERPAPTFERDGTVLPSPRAYVLVEGVPYGFVWCASDYIDSCILDDPSRAWEDEGRQARYREIVAQVRQWDAELPTRDGVDWPTEILNRVTPRFPRPPLWLAVGLFGLVFLRPVAWRTILLLWLSAALVLLIHAASQGVAPEFALPLYPVFIVTALGAVAGERRSRGAAIPAGEP